MGCAAVDEVAALAAGHERLDATQAGAAFDPASILLDQACHLHHFFRRGRDRTARGVEGLDVVLDEKLRPSKFSGGCAQIGCGRDYQGLWRPFAHQGVPVGQMVAT